MDKREREVKMKFCCFNQMEFTEKSIKKKILEKKKKIHQRQSYFSNSSFGDFLKILFH